jgi:hypothetical protein
MGSLDDTLRRRKTHWSGGLRIISGTSVSIRLAGFPACCSGSRAESIRDVGEWTTVAEYVSCKRCLSLMARNEVRL